MPLPLRVPGIAEATLSTGAGIVSGAGYGAIAADMVDMETFAVLRACQFFGVPLIGLRGISDGAAELSHVGDWTEYLHVIDEKLADAVDRLEAAIRAGLLNPMTSSRGEPRGLAELDARDAAANGSGGIDIVDRAGIVVELPGTGRTVGPCDAVAVVEQAPSCRRSGCRRASSICAVVSVS